ncbi:MAG: hypothetical protein RML12_10875 [Xanthomonadales bacterium]|nr:hypothetical protein [Xanthomonadales bacterium]
MLAYEAGATSVILEGGLRRSLNDDLDRCDELELTAINEQGPFMLIDAADTRIHGWEPEFSALPRNGLRRCGITGAVSARDVRFKRGEPSDPRGPRARAGSGLASSLGLDLTHPFGAGQLTCSAPHRFADVHFPNVANSQTIEIARRSHHRRARRRRVTRPRRRRRPRRAQARRHGRLRPRLRQRRSRHRLRLHERAAAVRDRVHVLRLVRPGAAMVQRRSATSPPR